MEDIWDPVQREKQCRGNVTMEGVKEVSVRKEGEVMIKKFSEKPGLMGKERLKTRQLRRPNRTTSGQDAAEQEHSI